MAKRKHGEAQLVRAASVAEVRAAKCLPVTLDGHTVALCQDDGGEIFAVDNRCPHMGFPLHRGTVRDGILTCHWHHARFDLRSGGTFDLFADDVRAFPVVVRDGEVYVDLAPRGDMIAHHRRRLADGLERAISLVTAKSTIALLDGGVDPVEPFRDGLAFGVGHRVAGWGSGLTVHTCMMNVLPALDPADRPRALFHGLSAVANDTAGSPARFPIRPLPDETADFPTLKRWFRRFVEVRDSEGAERCIVSAIRAGADSRQMADLLTSAVTDHRYINAGHPLDFTNKAFEALDRAGWEHAEVVLTSLAAGYAGAGRSEESNAWRYPVDLVDLLDAAFDTLPGVIEDGRERRSDHIAGRGADPRVREELIRVLLGEDPVAIVDALLDALRTGVTEAVVAGIVAYSAALRIARFHTRNEFGDWDTALHTFTFANAVHQGLRRLADYPAPEGYPLLVRGVFDAAMSVYLDRFLNIPSARIPSLDGEENDPAEILAGLPALLDRQQQVNEAGELVARYFAAGGDPDRIRATLGRLLLREDRNFHTIQMIEAAFRQEALPRATGGPDEGLAGTRVLIAAARYLAAHAPTMRTQGQTFEIAERLHRGENLFEEE